MICEAKASLRLSHCHTLEVTCNSKRKTFALQGNGHEVYQGLESSWIQGFQISRCCLTRYPTRRSKIYGLKRARNRLYIRLEVDKKRSVGILTYLTGRRRFRRSARQPNVAYNNMQRAKLAACVYHLGKCLEPLFTCLQRTICWSFIHRSELCRTSFGRGLKCSRYWFS